MTSKRPGALARAGAHFTSHRKAYVIAAIVLAGVAGLAYANRSDAQTAGTITFTAQTTTGDVSVTPVLTWDTQPLASNCVASGDWSGPKGGAGNETLAPITSSKTYNLECTWPGDQRVTLRWSAPTTNVDGSTITDLAGFKIYYGLVDDAAALAEVADVPNAGASVFVIEPLDAGRWYFAMSSYNQRNVESLRTATVNKLLTGSAAAVRSIGITVNPRPSPPSNVIAE